MSIGANNEQDYESSLREENKAARFFTVLLLAMFAGGVIGYTWGVGVGERNAVIACWKR
jgi:hypothetical protein